MNVDHKHFYITTPIYYVNDRPHIGHAYTTIASDVMARFMALDGYKTKFLTGTDEHGQKVHQAAAAKGIHPQDFTDEVSLTFRNLAMDLNASHDDFIRTTEARHKKAVQYLWRVLEKKGYIYKGTYAGWYAMQDEAYYSESEIVDGKAPTGAKVAWVEESTYFFKLSAFGDRLLAHYKSHPDFVMPKSRLNEVISFVSQGLQDLSISRTTFSWGVQVPSDPDHVVYVWLDALTNYLSALGFPDESAAKMGGLSNQARCYWENCVHVVGKDILRFHAIFWPAFLMGADLPLPKQIYAHGWWTNEGQKISKSVGNVIDPYHLIDSYGLDPMRYFMMREVPFGKDGDFSKRAMVGRLNSDLANDLGNLCQRVLSFVQKHAKGQVPENGPFTPEDQSLLNQAYGLIDVVRPLIQQERAIHRYAETVWQLISAANRYIDAQQPWSLRKSDPARMGTVLYVLLEVLRILGIIISPIMPTTMGKLLDMLAVPKEVRCFKALNSEAKLKAGVKLSPPAPLFPRYVEDNTAEQRAL